MRLVHSFVARALLASTLVAELLSAQSQYAVESFYGAFGTEVPIVVPQFHSITPSLKLLYSTTGGNGWLGVGWSLSGASTIQRVCPGKGAASFTSSDTFLLDGCPLGFDRRPS